MRYSRIAAHLTQVCDPPQPVYRQQVHNWRIRRTRNVLGHTVPGPDAGLDEWVTWYRPGIRPRGRPRKAS